MSRSGTRGGLRRGPAALAALAAAAFFYAAPLWAEEAVKSAGNTPPPAPGPLAAAMLSGSLRGAYWGASPALDGRKNLGASALWLKSEPRLDAATALLFEGRVTAADMAADDRARSELREAYLQRDLGGFDLRLGRQIIAWGRADRLNPTDTLTPRDFTLPAPEDDDQRFGATAAKAVYHAGGMSYSTVWLPEFRGHIIPLNRPSAAVDFAARDPQGVQSQWAFKADHSGQTVDWSASYYDGYDLNPDVGIGGSNAGRATLLLEHHRIRVLGADAATVSGRYGFRAEAAYTFTGDDDGRNPLVKNPNLYAVAGVERSFQNDVSLNLQYVFRYIDKYRHPDSLANGQNRSAARQLAVLSNQMDRLQHGTSVRLAGKWLNETLEGEIAGVVTYTRFNFVLRPKLVYALTDHWKATAGMTLYRGGEDSFYGRLRDNSGAFLEFRYSF